MTRITLEVQSGPDAGRKVWLRPGQMVEVGRSEGADFAVQHDSTMSGVHFGLECDYKACRIRDRNSRGGTFVNGQKVTEAELHDGDKVAAGQTTFVVRIEGSTTTAVSPPSAPAPEHTPTAQVRVQATPPTPIADQPAQFSSAAAPAEQRTEPAFEPASRVRETSAVETGRTDVIPPVAPVATPSQLIRPAAPQREPLESVVLEIARGPAAGRKIWLRPRQAVHVGRTDAAEFAVPGDPLMSSVHFVVECEPTVCRVRDRNSRNGTFVNGEPTTEAVLRDGDSVTAGQTTFVVRMRFATETHRARPVEAESVRVPAATVPAPIVTPPRARSAARPTYTEKRCNSGVTLYLGFGEQPEPANVARLVARSSPLHLMIDLNKLEIPAPSDMARCDYLFEMLAPEVIAQNSPLVVSSTDTRELYSLLEKAWGKDSLVCLYSRKERDGLVRHLRAVARCAFPGFGESPGERVLGFCWPGILEMLLAHSTPEFAQYLLAGIDAYLLEFGEPNAWQLFARDDFERTLEQLGFVRLTNGGGTNEAT